MFSPDVLLVMGTVLMVFGVPRTIAGLSNSRAPIDGVLMLLAGFGIAFWGWQGEPRDYGFYDIPLSFYKVFALWWNS